MSLQQPLLPVPRTLVWHDGRCALPLGGVTWAACDDTLGTPVVLDLLAEALLLAGSPLHRDGSPLLALAPWRTSPMPPSPEAYRLVVAPNRIRIEAASSSGAQHAAATLRQLARLSVGSAALPCLAAEDWPDFPRRGILLDISRDKVPTLATLFGLVDRMVELKLNELQLYTEHTFAYSAHREVWRFASPITADEIRMLDAYCRARHIDLVPNQNAFGHLERWLRLPAYVHLAEAPDGFVTPWGSCRHPFSLCPTDPRAEDFVAGRLAELLPNFSSPHVNVGCDETFDIGQGRSRREVEQRGGRVYLDFLLKIHRIVSAQGRRMQFWGDILLHHPELIAEIPRDVIALVWGYEADHPFQRQCEAFAASGLDFHVCPGTSSWRSVTGRTDNAIANLRSAAVHGLAAGAKGYLITDWGDAGHWQTQPVSYPGYACGASVAWAVGANQNIALDAALDAHVFNDPAGKMGRTVLNLGNLYCVDGLPAIGNATVFFNALQTQPEVSMPKIGTNPEPYRTAANRAAELTTILARTRLQGPDASLTRDEMTFAGTLARWGLELCAARAGGTEQRLPADWIPGRHGLPLVRQMRAEHARLWLARNRPGGLAESLARMTTLYSTDPEPKDTPA